MKVLSCRSGGSETSFLIRDIISYTGYLLEHFYIPKFF